MCVYVKYNKYYRSGIYTRAPFTHSIYQVFGHAPRWVIHCYIGLAMFSKNSLKSIHAVLYPKGRFGLGHDRSKDLILLT